MSEEDKVVTVTLGVVEGAPSLVLTGDTDNIVEYHAIWSGMMQKAKAEAIDALINSCLENGRGILAKEIQAHIESHPTE